MIPNDIQQRVVDECKKGMTGAAAARKYKISPSSVVNILKRNNVPTKTGRPPTCVVNHHAFDKLTPDNEYWIGFLFADGGIAEQGNSAQIILELAKKDVAHIEQFRGFLNSTHKIAIVHHRSGFSTNNAAVLRVTSRRLVDQLRNIGMHKKGPLRCPVGKIRNSIHFWRGCIDGDGTVRITTDTEGRRYPDLILCGHRRLMLEYIRFWRRRRIKLKLLRASTGNIFYVRKQGHVAKEMISLLYKDARVALKRKHISAQQIMNDQY